MTTENDRPTTPPATPGQTPETLPRPKPGAPKGNQNARKHTPFYFGDLPAGEQAQANMDRVLSARDLRPEVTMLRMSLVRLLADPATKPSDIAGAVRAIASVLRTQARLAPPRVRVRTPLSIQGQTTSKLGDPQLRHQALHDGLNELGSASETTPAQAVLPAENNPINDRPGLGAHPDAE